MEEGTQNELRPVRRVTARELARFTAELLDEMEDQGLPVMVCRYGRDVAMLTPVGRRGRVPRDRPRLRPLPGEKHAEPFEPIELSPLQEDLLRKIVAESPGCIGAPPNHYSRERLPEVMVAVAGLERADLIVRDIGGWRATVRGIRQVEITRM